MTVEDFTVYWEQHYPKCPPIAHFLKWHFPDRWFRIHSLPESKRYAEDDKEWSILLNRQNTIITDLLGEDDFILVTGYFNDYHDEIMKAFPEELQKVQYKFMPTIKGPELDSDTYDEDDVYHPLFTELEWQSEAYNSLLKLIANDKV